MLGVNASIGRDLHKGEYHSLWRCGQHSKDDKMRSIDHRQFIGQQRYLFNQKTRGYLTVNDDGVSVSQSFAYSHQGPHSFKWSIEDAQKWLCFL